MVNTVAIVIVKGLIVCVFQSEENAKNWVADIYGDIGTTGVKIEVFAVN